MNRRAAALILLVLMSSTAGRIVSGQVVYQPTTVPTITADDESWYLNGEAITYAGNVYYPAGAQIYFNATEMVRSGFFMGIPLYTRPTIEPYSVVYVPLQGGRMQPYQRPRTGELTGTSGSVPSVLPHPGATVPPRGLALQAAGPPSQTALVIPMQITGSEDRVPLPSLEASVGMAGRVPPPPQHVQIGDPPEGTQSIFIEYEGRRWYPIGHPEPLNPAGLVRLPDYHGFAVWAKSQEPTEILISVSRGSNLANTYSLTKPATPFR
jgi:hypothetical protein